MASDAEMLRTIEEKLNEMEREVSHLRALRAIYQHRVAMDYMSRSGQPASSTHRPGLPLLPPVPEAEKLPLTMKSVSGGKTGLSEAVLKVVERHPGLDSNALVTRILESVKGDYIPTREAVRSIVSYLVKTNRLEKRGGGYYPIPKQPDLKLG